MKGKSAQKLTGTFRIEGWIFNTKTKTAIGPSGEVYIGSRLMKMMICLAENRGDVVLKDQLLRQVWRNVIVSDESITKSISDLRRMFEPSNGSAPEIETLRGVGYRLKSPVSIVQSRNKRVFYNKIVWGSVLMGILLSFLILKLDVFKSTPVSTVLVNHTNNNTIERVPRISWDGTKILYAQTERGANNLDIYALSMADHSVQIVQSSGALETDPIWLQDNYHVAMISQERGKKRIVFKDLRSGFEKDVVGLNSVAPVSAMVWNPTNNSIIYADSEDGTFYLSGVNIDDGETARLTTPPEGILGDMSPRLLSGKDKVAFIRVYRRSQLYPSILPGEGHIMIQSLADNKLEQVTNERREVTGISWFDDDHLVYAVAYKNNLYRIYLLHIKSGLKKMVYETSEVVRNLDYHPESSKLVFESWKINNGIWTYELSDSNQPFFKRRLFDENIGNWMPYYHKNSSGVAFISDASGFKNIWTFDSKNGDRQQLTNHEDEIPRRPRVSNKGDKILYRLVPSNTIYVVELSTKEVDTINNDENHKMFPTWSADDSSVYYGSNKSGTYEIWSTEINSTGRDKQLTFSGGIRAIEYNNALYVFKIDGSIWQQYPDGIERKLISNLRFEDARNWEVFNEIIYFIRRDNFGIPVIMRQPIESSIPEMVLTFRRPTNWHFFGFSIVDEKTILASINEFSKSDIITIDMSSYKDEKLSLVLSSVD